MGIRAGGWHAIVNERGAIRMDEDDVALDWYVAADDRWHNPAQEPSVRQTRRAGVPVVETRLWIRNLCAFIFNVFHIFGGFICLFIHNPDHKHNNGDYKYGD